MPKRLASTPRSATLKPLSVGTKGRRELSKEPCGGQGSLLEGGKGQLIRSQESTPLRMSLNPRLTDRLRRLLRVKEREDEREQEESGPQVSGQALQEVGGLRPQEMVRHAHSERYPESFIPRPMHENEQGDEERNQDVKYQEYVDGDGMHTRGIWSTARQVKNGTGPRGVHSGVIDCGASSGHRGAMT